MEIFNVFTEMNILMLSISLIIFMKKNINNMMSLFFLLMVILFQTQYVELQYYGLLFIISILVSNASSDLKDILLRYLSAITILIYMFVRSDFNIEISILYFSITLVIIALRTKSISKKLLAITVTTFPLVSVENNTLHLIFIAIPFLLLPLLYEKLQKRDFSIFCLTCMIILGHLGLLQKLPSILGFVMLSIFILMNQNSEKKTELL